MTNSRKKKKMDECEMIKEMLLNGQYEEKLNLFEALPSRDKVINELDKEFKILRDRSVRIYKVEEIINSKKDIKYEIFIKIPGSKTEGDFVVCRAIWERGKLQSIKTPSHDDLAKMFLELKKKDPLLDEYLINATIRYIRDRLSFNDILQKYFSPLMNSSSSEELLMEISKFFFTLKWIALQEDVNYPSKEMLGSLYTLMVFAVSEITGDVKHIRRVLRF
jgi:hypothetical protein